MNCQRIQEQFLDYQGGLLPAPEADEIREHLKTCLTCQREWAALQEITLKLDRVPPVAPSPRLRTQFYAMLETHRRESASRNPFIPARHRWDRFFAALLPSRPPLQFAMACALLGLGLFVGSRYLHSAAPATDPATARELASLRSEVDSMGSKVDSMGQVMSYSLLRQQPASERVQTVLATMDLKHTDQQIISGLLNTLAFDPSVNVRLSTLEALFPHANLPEVRSAVAAALPREPSPLVQVTMIDFLAASRDPSAVSTLEDVSQMPTYDKSVREAAQHALARL